MGRRHLTPWEIKEQCKRIARESRMAYASPWTAMGIVCGYTLYKSEGFKGPRISKVITRIDELTREFWENPEAEERESKRLFDKAEWTIEFREYSESDITAKKGSYQWWLDQRQLDPQNVMNKEARRYMIFMFSALMDLYGYGRQRLTRVQEFMLDMLRGYAQDKSTVGEWRRILYDDLGLVFEQPKDPKDEGYAPSIMTGMEVRQ